MLKGYLVARFIKNKIIDLLTFTRARIYFFNWHVPNYPFRNSIPTCLAHDNQNLVSLSQIACLDLEIRTKIESYSTIDVHFCLIQTFYTQNINTITHIMSDIKH